MAVERCGTMVNPGVAFRVDWLKRHDAMQGRTPCSPYRNLASEARMGRELMEKKFGGGEDAEKGVKVFN